MYRDRAVLQVCSAHIFNTGGPSTRGYDVAPPGEGKDKEASLQVSRARAKAKVRDIAYCNHFDYFFTWTIDGNLLDRYDPQKVYKKLRSTLSNAVHRHEFEYVIVPEYHQQKEGETTPAIHMHGLCNPGTLPLERAASPKTGRVLCDRSGRPIYHMPSWKFGFSSCVPLDSNYEKAVNYVVKYLGKADSKIFGKWYLASRNLVKSPGITLLEPMEYDEVVTPDKLASGQQFEIELYGNVRLAEEELHFE